MTENREETGYKTPRWVKIFVVAFIVLALIFATMHLSGMGIPNHGQHQMSTEVGQP